MKTVILHGALGKMFGRRHRLDVKTAAEAVRALIANFPRIEKYLIEHSAVGYRVKLHDSPLMDTGELHHPVGGSTITFTPVVAGSKNILGTILMGVALVALAFATGGASIAASGLLVGGVTTTFWGSIALSLGVSMVIGGIAQMIAPMPKTGDPKERPENQPSYGFNGAVNTSAQGQPVPVGYGRLMVGGAIISAGYSTEEIPV